MQRGDNRIPQASRLFDLHFENISGLEQHRRLAKDADAIRRAARNHIARLQA